MSWYNAWFMPLALKEKLTAWLWQLLEHRLISPVQPIDIVRPDGTVEFGILAALDVHSEVSCIDKNFVKELGLQFDPTDEISYLVNGKNRQVPVLTVTFRLNGQPRTGRWAVVSRSHERHLICLGKADTAGFLIELPEPLDSTQV